MDKLTVPSDPIGGSGCFNVYKRLYNKKIPHQNVHHLHPPVSGNDRFARLFPFWGLKKKRTHLTIEGSTTTKAKDTVGVIPEKKKQ